MKYTTGNLKCAICGKESSQLIILSSNNFGTKTQLDLRVVGDQINLKNKIQQCPHCLYSNYNIEENVGIEKQDLNNPDYTEILKSNLDNTAKMFILNAILLDKVNKNLDAGIMYHYASWVFDDLNDTENADKYRKKACERIYEFAIQENDGESAVQAVDLMRRNGDFEKALELVSEIGKTDIEEIDKILAFEKKLISEKDRDSHFVEEVL